MPNDMDTDIANVFDHEEHTDNGDHDFYEDDFDDDFDADDERIRRKVNRPQGKKRIATLKTPPATDAKGEVVQDPLIHALMERGHITEVVAELKSGKEATAYIARRDEQSLLLKIYRDLEARSFKNDQIYKEDRQIVDQRAKRAILGRSRKGLQLVQAEWVLAEYKYLWILWQAGLPVPKPMVGPQVKACAETIPTVLMELIGTEDEVAPRLSDAELSPTQAQQAWQQAIQGMSELLRLGYVHGDYSAYNLLWWENTVIMIDVPQLSTKRNPQFKTLLERDAASLAQSFRRHGIQLSAEETLREVQRGLQRPAPAPRLVLP